MFKVIETYEVFWKIFEYDYIYCSPPSLDDVNTVKSRKFFGVPGNWTAISVKDSFFQLEFEFKHRAAEHMAQVNTDKIVQFRPKCFVYFN